MLVRCYDSSALLFYTYPRSSRHYATIPSFSLSFIFIYALTVSFFGDSSNLLICTNSFSACRNFLSKAIVSVILLRYSLLSELPKPSPSGQSFRHQSSSLAQPNSCLVATRPSVIDILIKFLTRSVSPL